MAAGSRYRTVLLLLCGLALLPIDVLASDRTFSKGSLIIPMDQAHQSAEGTLAAYGLVYMWLQSDEVSVYVAINSSKTSVSSPDFTLGQSAKVVKTGSAAVTTGGTAASKTYVGAPFVVDVKDADRAIRLMQTNKAPWTGFVAGGSKAVTIHEVQIEFTAEIAAEMRGRPRRVVLPDEKVDILESYMEAAGLDFPGAAGCFPESAGCSGGHGQVYDILNPSQDFAPLAGLPEGRLNALNSNSDPVYGVLWLPHWDDEFSPQVRKNIEYFHSKGNAVFAQCAAIRVFEGDSGCGSTGPETRFMSKCGIDDGGKAKNAEFPHPGNEFVQIGDWPFKPEGGSLSSWKPRLNGYRKDVVRLITNAKDGSDLATLIPSVDDRGPVVYLGGHQYDSVAGIRLVLATLLNFQTKKGKELELARSEPVNHFFNEAGKDTLQVFAGTYFESKPPSGSLYRLVYDPTGYGASERAARWEFPYHPGNFYAFNDFPSGTSEFSEQAIWNAGETISAMLPKDRLLYTTIGGRATRLEVAAFGPGCADTDGNSVCDLSQVMGLTGDTDSDPYHSEKHLISRIHGFCLSNENGDNYSPSDSQCDLSGARNHPVLGGVDHSTAVVVGESKNVSGGSSRPTVAYFGAQDGMLHAIYVRGGGEFGSFVPPAAGTELWAFIPQEQLSLVRNNSANLDASPAHAEVKLDLGSGEAYRDLLVVSSGISSEGIVALDVSDPTRPELLWSIIRGTVSDHPKTTALPLPNGQTVAVKTREGNTPGTTSANHSDTLYDFSDLGHTYGLAIGEIEGAPTVFACTNFGPNSSGRLEVFAIDLASGKKVWQFERSYKTKTSDNSIPGSCALVDWKDGPEGDNLIIGDMDGRVWDLDLKTGENRWFDAGDDYPLFATNSASQPVSTTVFPFNSVGHIKAATNSVKHDALLFGTAGMDWVPSSAKGRIYALAYPPSPLSVSAGSLATGVATPLAGFPVILGVGEGLRGTPKAVAGVIVATTTKGSLEGDIADSAREPGRILELNYSGAMTRSTLTTKAAGGAALSVNMKEDGTADVSIRSLATASKTRTTTNVKLPPPPPATLSRVHVLRWREIPL